MFEKFTQSARAAVEDAREEAARRGDKRIGTEHLLLALLRDETIARAIGADNVAARHAAEEMDRAALLGVGINVGSTEIAGHPRWSKHMPLTSAAKNVIRQTLVHATAEKSKTITSRHMTLAVLDGAAPDPAAALLDALSVDPAAAREKLSSSS
jgi:ATP-dependent Clp protease ATP-binding subunit ClpA